MTALDKPLATRSKPACIGFGFCPAESAHHFLVTIPASNREDVLISEHMSWDESEAATPPTFAFGEAEGKLRALLARAKWNAIADEVRVELNKRLKQDGLKSGSWKTGTNPVSGLLGKELVLLAWAIEEADPALIPAAIRVRRSICAESLRSGALRGRRSLGAARKFAQ